MVHIINNSLHRCKSGSLQGQVQENEPRASILTYILVGQNVIRDDLESRRANTFELVKQQIQGLQLIFNITILLSNAFCLR